MADHPEAIIQVRFFGQLEVSINAELIEHENWTPKTISLFSILASSRGQVFSKDKLIEVLFPNYDASKAETNLRSRISKLRRILEPDLKKAGESNLILTVGVGNYSLSESNECWVDIEQFDDHLTEAQASRKSDDWSSEYYHLIQANSLYRGPFLRDYSYEDWVIPFQERFEDQQIDCLRRLVNVCIDLGKYNEALSYCDELFSLDRPSELLYVNKMRCHYYLQEKDRALETYSQCQQYLKAKFQAIPTKDTTQLYEDIKKNKLNPNPIVNVAHNIPREPNPLLGRQKEIQKLTELFQQSAFVTILGPGGVGKSRLAFKLARNLLHDFSDGIWIIQLANISDSDLVIHAVSTVLNIKQRPGQSIEESVVSFLSRKKTMLVFDNCEHVLTKVVDLVHLIMNAAEHLIILATSRESFDIVEETILPLQGLAHPRSNESEALRFEELFAYPAVQLLADRAKAADYEIVASKHKSADIISTCVKLDGLPLALELAAAQLKSISLHDLHMQISERIDVLSQRTIPSWPRHQTLRATIDWSYDFLSENEQILLQRLSIFFGGWTLDAAEKVCSCERIPSSEVLESLSNLVNKSLARFDKVADMPRYGMLETIKQYAAEKLSLNDAYHNIANKHLQYIIELVRNALPQLNGPNPQSAIAKLQAETGNIRSALEYSIEVGKIDMALELSALLGRYWWLVSHNAEGVSWIQRAMRNSDDATPETFLEALNWLCILLSDQNFFEESKPYLYEMINLAKKLNASAYEATALLILGHSALAIEDYPDARNLYRQAYKLADKAGDKMRAYLAMESIGHAENYFGDYRKACRLHERAIRNLRTFGDPLRIAKPMSAYSMTLLELGRIDEALDTLKESMSILQGVGDQIYRAFYFKRLARIFFRQAKFRDSAVLQGALYAAIELHQTQLFPPEAKQNGKIIESLKVELGVNEYEKAFEQGLKLSVDDAQAFAFGELELS